MLEELEKPDLSQSFHLERHFWKLFYDNESKKKFFLELEIDGIVCITAVESIHCILVTVSLIFPVVGLSLSILSVMFPYRGPSKLIFL